MKLKILGKNLKTKFRPKKDGDGAGRSDDSIAASELVEDHLASIKSSAEKRKQDNNNIDEHAAATAAGTSSGGGAGDAEGADDATAESSSLQGANVEGGVGKGDAAQQPRDDDSDDMSQTTQARLTQSISYVLGEEDRKQTKLSKAAAARDETESSGRPPRGHKHSSSRTSAPSHDGCHSSADDQNPTLTASGDRSIKSRERSLGSIEIRGSRSIDGSVLKEKAAEHGSKMVFDFDENGIQGVDLAKHSSSYDSDDTNRCPTVIMDEENIEIVNSMSDTSESNDHHKTRKKNKITSSSERKAATEPKASSGQHLIEATDRVVIVVSSIDKSVKFYSLLGFERTQRPTHLNEQTTSDRDEAWLSNGKITLYLFKGTLSDKDSVAEKPTMGHISLYAPKAEKAIRMLRSTTVPFIANVRMVGTGIDKESLRQAFIRDPDGNYIEICNLKEISSVSPTDSRESKTAIVGNIMRRLMSNSDLRSSFDDGEEVDLEFDDTVIDTATDLVKSLSETNMTTGPSSVANFIAKHQSHHRLKSSKSASYLDAAKCTSPVGIEKLKSFDSSSDATTLGDLIESVNHLNLTVSDVKRSLKFYTDVFDLKQVVLPYLSKNGDVGSLIAGDVIINLVRGEPKVQNSLDGQAFFNVSEIKYTIKSLQEKRIPYRVSFACHDANSATDGSLIEAYVTDPDGYPIAVGNYAEAERTQSAGAAAATGDANSREAEEKPIPREYQPASADPKILRNFSRRRKFEGDVCYQFTRNELKNILRQAGNDAPKAMLLMNQRRERDAERRAAKKKSEDTEASGDVSSPSSIELLCCGGCC